VWRYTSTHAILFGERVSGNLGNKRDRLPGRHRSPRTLS
jgi:hypothetical protein